MTSDETKPYREQWVRFIYDLQKKICAALELEDGSATFKFDNWSRGQNEGGGSSGIIQNGNVFEKAGVNVSVVYGAVTDNMKKIIPVQDGSWFASGISMVLHPLNPFVPTIHANWRYFEAYDCDKNINSRWFGGGIDLTPYYLFEADVLHFHTTLKKTIDPFGPALYEKYKQQCDNYFTNAHRNNEMRGVGGVFYDHLYIHHEDDANRLFSFQEANGNAFLNAYIPIVQKRKQLPFTTMHKQWQEIRRGRYVEFNLLYDRGTLFGLKTKGRIESILMSLPPTVRFTYDYTPLAGSEEEKLLKICQQPKSWI